MKGIIVQFIATFIVAMGNYFTGFGIAWTSYTLETLGSDHSPFGDKITKFEGNMIGSLPMFGSFFSTLVTGWLTDNIGRKRSAILCGLCFVLAWSITTTASNISTLLAGRFVEGIAYGMQVVICLPLVSELGQTSIRGTLISLLTAMYCLGTLMSYVYGWMCSYRFINYLSLTLSVCHVILVCLLKETPAYLMSKGKEEEALESLKFYRGVSNPTQEVLNELNYLRSQRETSKIANLLDTEKSNLEPEKEKLRQQEICKDITEMSAWKILITSKPSRRALVITSMNMMLMVFSGTIAVTAYAAQLFATAAPSLSPNMCSVILAVSFAVASLLATVITDLVGRRVVMITSAALSSLCLALLASLLRWSWAPQWSIPAAVLAYCCCFQTGVANVPFVQISELFPPKLSSLATVIAVAVMSMSNFIVLAIFGPMVDALNLDGTFFVFFLISIITTLTAYFFMKETKGVPIEVVQQMYEHGFLYRKSYK